MAGGFLRRILGRKSGAFDIAEYEKQKAEFRRRQGLDPKVGAPTPEEIALAASRLQQVQKGKIKRWLEARRLRIEARKNEKLKAQMHPTFDALSTTTLRTTIDPRTTSKTAAFDLRARERLEKAIKDKKDESIQKQEKKPNELD